MYACTNLKSREDDVTHSLCMKQLIYKLINMHQLKLCKEETLFANVFFSKNKLCHATYPLNIQENAHLHFCSGF